MTIERPLVYSNISYSGLVASCLLGLTGVAMIVACLCEIGKAIFAALILIAIAINYFYGLSLSAGHFPNCDGLMAGLFFLPIGWLLLWAAAQIMSESLYEARFWAQEDTLFCKQRLRLPFSKLPRLGIAAPPPLWRLLRSEVDRFEVTRRVNVSKGKNRTVEITYYQVSSFPHTGDPSPLLWFEPRQAAKAQGVCDQLNAWLDGNRP